MKFIAGGSSVVLFPDATRKIWTGSGSFKTELTGDKSLCCASYVEVVSGECAEVVCIAFPVIVDGEAPEATVEICLVDCECAGCEIVFSSHTNEEECLPGEVICGDDCSGLASWAIDIYDRYPFDECCEVPCYEPIESDSGVCPIDFTTVCLTDLVAGIVDTVYVVVTLVDNVGNDTRFGATITFNPDTCDILTVTPWPADECVDHPTFVVCDVTGLEVNFIDVPDEDVNDGPDAVVLGNYGDYDYGDFVILSKTGITNTGSHTSVINGDIGTSPETAATMNDIWCTEIIGTIVGVDAAYVGSGVQTCFAGNPPLSNKTWVDNAILNMVTVYNTTAGIPNPDGIDLYGGNIGGQTFAPGLYKWNSDVIIATSVTLSGGANDVWIFQIAGDLSISSAGGIEIILSGGALASNVFWQVGGGAGATLGTYSIFNGTILSAKAIIIQTGAVLNGRAWAQSTVTLDASTVGL